MSCVCVTCPTHAHAAKFDRVFFRMMIYYIQAVLFIRSLFLFLIRMPLTDLCHGHRIPFHKSRSRFLQLYHKQCCSCLEVSLTLKYLCLTSIKVTEFRSVTATCPWTTPCAPPPPLAVLPRECNLNLTIAYAAHRTYPDHTVRFVAHPPIQCQNLGFSCSTFSFRFRRRSSSPAEMFPWLVSRQTV